MTQYKLMKIINMFSEFPIKRIVDSNAIKSFSNEISDISVVEVDLFDNWICLFDKKYLLICVLVHDVVQVSIRRGDFFNHELNLVKTLKIRELE